ncbi:MAG: ComEC/Rec2 family competence protein [Clostridia bacterium]|nr:ComEC/Rec2 family competence protein [Clostridia bacterium]
MDATPRFRRLFFGQSLCNVGIPFLLGVFIFVQLPSSFSLVCIGFSGAFLLLLLAAPWGRKNRKFLLLAALGLALALLAGGREQLHQIKMESLHGRELLCRGVVTVTSDSEYDLSATAPFRGKVRVTVEDAPAVGAVVEVKLSLSSRVLSSAKQEGVDLTAFEIGARSSVGKNGWYTLVGDLRQRATAAFGESREAGFLRAILLGDRSALFHQDRVFFQKTSSSHLLAISGLHVSQLLGIVFAVLCLFPVNRKLRSLLMLPLVFFLLFFTGASVSVFRSALMAAFPLVGFLFRRRSHPVTALIFAAVLLVSREPYCVLSPSFLLSFFSTFGILMAAGPLCTWFSFRIWEQVPGRFKWLKKWCYLVISSFITASASFVFTFPITLLFFGEVQPFAPVYALVMIPLFSPCLFLALIAAVLIPVPAVGLWAMRLARAGAYLFLRFHEFAAKGAPPLLEFGDFAPFVALVSIGLILFLLVSRRPIYHLFFLHGGFLMSGMILWCTVLN